MNDKDLLVLNFENINVPLATESKNTSPDTMVNWGLNNNYPAFLVDLYNQSSVHSAIINQKTTYIIGAGLVDVNNKPLDIQVNPSDNLGEFVSKVIKDYLMFTSFGVEVVFNVFGQPIEMYHVPMHKVRTSKNKTKFWINDDWLLTRKYIQYDRYSPSLNQDGTSKLFYFDGYFPSINNTYSTPEYAGAIKSIMTDIAIKEFNLNNIKNSFSVSSLITFFQGANVSEEVKRKMIQEIERSYKGENGKKLIIDFQTKDGKSAEVRNISANDWDKAYTQVAQQTIDDIMIGHQVQSPALFAIKSAGQLGNTQELLNAYEIFKANYVSVKRQEIESALNQLFLNFDAVNGKVRFQDKPLFQSQIDSVKMQVLTVNEIREAMNYPKISGGDVLVGQPMQIQAEKVEEDVKKKSGHKLKEEDYDLIKHLGVSAEDFDEVEPIKFDKEKDIADYLISKDIKNLSISELVDVLANEGKIKTTEGQVQRVLDKLQEAGIAKVNISNNRIEVLPLPTPDIPDSNRILTMYKYVKRPEASGGDLLSTSRSFCVRMIQNNRLYTREEIQEMSAIFNYNIFKFCGGYWFNPETEEVTPHCRHQWQQVKVRRKSE
jgi:hypothetical protein